MNRLSRAKAFARTSSSASARDDALRDLTSLPRCMGCGEIVARGERACAGCVEEDERARDERRRWEEMER